MTREIKFRAWDKVDEKMYKVVRISDGIWGEGAEGPCVLMCGFNENPLEQKTNIRYSNLYELMQYTGLKDKNEKEIYEGDCLYAEGNLGGEDYIGYVSYYESEAKFVVRQGLHDRMEWIPNNECWVKGHIYEGNTP